MRRFVSVFVVLGFAMALFAALAAAQPQRNTMEVSIVATGKDNAPVQNLTQDDITIKDNNKKQEIISFEKVTPATPLAQGKPAMHHVVLLDSVNTTYADTPQIRLEFLKILNEFSKLDNVTLLWLRDNIKVVSDPGNPESMLKRIAKQGFDPAKPEALNWVFTEESALGGLFVPTTLIDRARYQAWLNVLKAIATNYQGRSGRKNFYWISRECPLVMGETGAGFLEKAAGSGADSASVDQGITARAGVAGGTRPKEDKDSRSDLFSAFSSDILMTGKMVANAGLSIYPIDARYLSRTPEAVSDKAKMTDLAKQTGGTACTSRQDVAACVKEAIGETATAYVARYVISDLKPDGKFHQIKIETKQKDVKLRIKDGYYAPQQGR